MEYAHKIIFEDQHQRSFLRSGKIQPFVKHAGGAAAIANPRHGYDFLSQVAPRHGHAGHDRNEIAEHGDGRNDVQIIQIAEVAGAVLAFGRRSILRHVLRENVARRHALYQQRTDIANHRRHPVAFLQRVRRAHGNGFLAQAGVQPANNFVLAEQLGHGLLDLAVQAHVVIEVQVLLARQFPFLRGFQWQAWAMSPSGRSLVGFLS